MTIIWSSSSNIGISSNISLEILVKIDIEVDREKNLPFAIDGIFSVQCEIERKEEWYLMDIESMEISLSVYIRVRKHVFVYCNSFSCQ